MSESEFLKQAEAAGIDQKAAAFLFEQFAMKGHDHTADQIVIDTEDGETLEDYIDFMDSPEPEN